MNVFVRDSVFNPNLSPSAPRKVHVREGKDGRPLYKVWLYLEGNDLPFVRGVVYRLHESFSDPVRLVPRSPSNPNCQLVIWTWGVFVVGAEIQDKKGYVYEVSHTLSYAEQLPDDSSLYVRDKGEFDESQRPTLKRAH
jgi:hypothetical protein